MEAIGAAPTKFCKKCGVALVYPGNWYKCHTTGHKKGGPHLQCKACFCEVRNKSRRGLTVGASPLVEHLHDIGKLLDAAPVPTKERKLAPPQTAPLPTHKGLKRSSGGQRKYRDPRITKNGQWAYGVEVVGGCPVFDIGHFMWLGHPDGSNDLCNLIAVSHDINILMGHEHKLPECTFYKLEDGSLVLRFAPKWLAYPYYADREGHRIPLSMLPPDPAHRPQAKYIEWHNAEFEKFCRQSFTCGRDAA